MTRKARMSRSVDTPACVRACECVCGGDEREKTEREKGGGRRGREGGTEGGREGAGWRKRDGAETEEEGGREEGREGRRQGNRR